MKTWGGCGALAKASARWPVPWTRLSRMWRFLVSVQRPTIDSPARWMTALKPETESGDSGRSGSHAICSCWGIELRTSRATAYPCAFRKGKRAVPIGPEAPLTRTRDEFTSASISTVADRSRLEMDAELRARTLASTLGRLDVGAGVLARAGPNRAIYASL